MRRERASTVAAWKLGLLATAALAWLALASAAAFGATIHPFVDSFDGGDAPGGPFASVIAVASDGSAGPSHGDVYVADSELFAEVSVIDKFDSNGHYAGVQIAGTEAPQPFDLFSFVSFQRAGIAVDSSASVNRGDIYVVDVEHHVVDKFAEDGTYVCQISGAATPVATECDAGGSAIEVGPFEPTRVAVDHSGDVYVSDQSHEVVDEFSPTGAFVRDLAGSHIASPTALAVAPNGDIDVENGGSEVVAFNPADEFLGVVDSNEPENIATNPGGSVDVFEQGGEPHSQIAEFESSGALRGRFGEERLRGSLSGLSVGPNGSVYAALFGIGEGAVQIFGPPVVVPDVALSPASGVEQTSATLHGSVGPDQAHSGAEVNGCEFEYGTSTEYGSTAPCSPAPPYSATTAVSAAIGSLTPDTTYHYRLRAASTLGANQTADETFVTLGPPRVESERANARTDNATVSAVIDPSGFTTECHVQYVDEATFVASGYEAATSVPCSATLPPGAAGTLSANLSGLAIGGHYRYRFIASNAAGTTTGADESFATFGIATFSVALNAADGTVDTQAGSHPYVMTDQFTFATSTNEFGVAGAVDANPKQIHTELPPGLIGNPTATPRCLPYDVAHASCSGATQVGLLKISTERTASTEVPIYNLVPPSGLAAQLGARINGFVTAHIDARVRTGGDYGITADAFEVSAGEGLTGASVELWGVPADSSHDSQRYCPVPNTFNEIAPCASDASPVPFLRTPTACLGPLPVAMSADAWRQPSAFVSAAMELPAMTGCERLRFTPSIALQPESHAADSPTGLSIHLHIPQNADPDGLAEADLKDAVVQLPQGLVANPAAAESLQGCSPAQIELHGPNPAQCPDASKIGTVEIATPLLDHVLKGAVYLAQQGNAGQAQGSNPFGSLLALYIAVADPQTGVVVKLAGEVAPDPATGQLRTTFAENPQLPFEDLQVNLFGGVHAPLTTPPSCGTYESQSTLTPWSAPQSGAPASLADALEINGGAGGGSCAPTGFSPAFSAGTVNNQAGAFSSFVLTLGRQDGEQRLRTIVTTLPPGIGGMLANVGLCGDAQAQAGTCPASSRIGSVKVTAGSGRDPIVIPQPGEPEDAVYLTGPYAGAPFGLAFVVPAKAGPFDLDEGGHPVIVRARIEVDPHTAQVMVVSDPLPSILQGIPLDVRSVSVTIDRERFVYNATSCDPMSLNARIESLDGGAASGSSRYEAAACAALEFAPKFSVSTSSHTAKATGASLRVKLSYPPGSLGTQANIKSVKVELPRSLPSRLTTLQRACTAKQFATNPGGCPPESVIGRAVVHTQLLPVPLEGPAYFVSNGGEAFPNLILVLQGYGVTVALVGNTLIKNGVTSSTFTSTPDVPFETFELMLPQGKYSALAANGNLCRQQLVMPTGFVGQDGATLSQSTHIAVEGCPDTLGVVSKPVRGRALTLGVWVPAAGRLSASGRGLTKASKASHGREELKLTLRDNRRGRFSTSVKLAFKPAKGKRLLEVLKVRFAK